MNSYQFDAVKVRDSLVQGIKDLAASQGFSRVVIGISGGKDSTVCAALCARALGKENVYGIMMPDGEQKDIADSRKVCEVLGIHQKTVNIGAMHRSLLEAVKADGFEVPFHQESDFNVGPRLRMTTLRYIAQAIGARLVGTGNLSEATVGYCTKDGDTSCDFSLLGNLTSVEVVEVGLTMEELPKELVQKTPSDGLSGKSDEERLGLKYADIHAYLRLGTCGDFETDEKIRRKERANMHKRQMPVKINPFV
ncbi:MAG: NAD(+) synthase [Firmicutes bacterium]|nr:NAD(+) synthase [Bacillota bacterium]